MKLILKGDIQVIGNFNVIQGVYVVLQQAINQLSKKPFEDDKRELSFKTEVNSLIGYTIKIIENSKTKTITVIVK